MKSMDFWVYLVLSADIDLIDVVSLCNQRLNDTGIKIDGFHNIYQTDHGKYLFPIFYIGNKEKYNLYDFRNYEEEEIADIIDNELKHAGISASCYCDYD